MSHDHEHHAEAQEQQLEPRRHEAGTVVRINYLLRVDGKVRETNIEDLAKLHGVHKQGARYKPLIAMLGGGGIIPGLEEYLFQAAEAGAELNHSLPPEKAFGERKAENIVHVPTAEFKKAGIKPLLGTEINRNGQKGIVTKVAGGRCVVDFNNELAGKTLDYEIRVLGVYTGEEECIRTIFEPMEEAGEVGFEFTSDMVTIHLPKNVVANPNWQQGKWRFLNDMGVIVRHQKALRFTETYHTPKPEPATAPSQLDPVTE